MQRIRLRVEVDLRGIHLGSELTGLTTEEMAARYPEFAARLRAWQTHQEGYANQPPDIPGGEPTSAFVTRVAAALGRIVTAGTDRAVIVCPASTIQAVHGLLADQSGAPPEKLLYEAVQAPHGSVEVWRVSPDGFPVCQNGGFQIPPA